MNQQAKEFVRLKQADKAHASYMQLVELCERMERFGNEDVQR